MIPNKCPECSSDLTRPRALVSDEDSTYIECANCGYDKLREEDKEKMVDDIRTRAGQ